MKRNGFKGLAAAAVIVASFVGAGWYVQRGMGVEARSRSRGPDEPEVTPVRVAPIQRAVVLEDNREFSGTLAARAKFVVAAEVSGRVASVSVALGDPVVRGQAIATLDPDRFQQGVAEAKSELAIGRSEHAAAERQVEISTRALGRVEALRDRGIASAEEFEAAQAQVLSAQAQRDVAQARIARANASLRTAKLELGYTEVRALWDESQGDGWVVAERHVDPGERVAVHAPLLSLVSLDPLDAIVFVAEEDYARLHVGLAVVLVAEAFPGETFQGRVERVAPVFQAETATARVEISVDNADHRLKPGMFIHAVVTLARAENATVVPEEAIVSRDGQEGVFVLGSEGAAVTFVPVELGIRGEHDVEVRGLATAGQVVTLGHEQLESGSVVRVPPVLPGEAGAGRS